MARVSVSVDIAAPLAAVWKEAADLASHAEWMRDAESIEFLGERRTGVGTRMRVATAVGPLRTTDLMEVVDWDEPRTIGVRHEGLITGSGRFRLAALAGRTRFTWTERLSFPWYLGGRVAALLAAPVLAGVWRRNLAALKRRIEG